MTMPYEMPGSTRFAAIHFSRCATQQLETFIPLGGDWSAHTAPVITLSKDDNERIGRDRAEEFQKANFVLLASRPSLTPWDRDAEWKDIEQQVFRLFFSLLMIRMPDFETATLTVGGRGVSGPALALHTRFLWYSPHAHAVNCRVTPAELQKAAIVAAGFREAVTSKDEFLRMKRGIYRLTRGWREEEYFGDRLHEFVRALEGLMLLAKGQGEAEFVARVATFAKGKRIDEIGREIYRLRSFNEHLSDWPSELAYVKESNRDRLLSERSFQAELIAGAAYRSVLADPILRESFRRDIDISAFWASETGQPLDGAVDLDAFSDVHQFREW
jgi:hypothetical protein